MLLVPFHFPGGLCVWLQEPWLAGSPDGLCILQGKPEDRWSFVPFGDCVLVSSYRLKLQLRLRPGDHYREAVGAYSLSKASLYIPCCKAASESLKRWKSRDLHVTLSSDNQSRKACFRGSWRSRPPRSGTESSKARTSQDEPSLNVVPDSWNRYTRADRL